MMTLQKKYKVIYKIASSLSCDIGQLTKLSSEQVYFINHFLKNCSYLEACAGSGKTEVIGIKSAYTIKRLEENNAGLAVVTFTTSAAKELNKRVRKYLALPSNIYPHFIGTFDSWIHNFLLQPYCHYLTQFAGIDGDKSIRIIEDDSHADFLKNFEVEIKRDGKRIPIKATQYYFSHDWKKVISNDEKIEKYLNLLSLQELAELKRNKINFIQKGFATYSDAEILCIKILKKYPSIQSKLAQRFETIIVDECQDLSEEQLSILEYFRNAGSSLHFVGDLNQSIYEFRKVNPQNTLTYINDNRFIRLKLTNNYRSFQSIVNVSQSIIGSSSLIEGRVQASSEKSCLLWEYNDQSFYHLPTKFEQLLNSRNISLANSAILARGKTTINDLRKQNDKYRFGKAELFAIAIDCWNKKSRTTDEISTALFCLGRALCLLAYNGQGNSINQYCPKNFDSVEWRLLMKRIMDAASPLHPFVKDSKDVNWSTWVADLKKFLRTIWPQLEGRVNEFDEIVNKIKAPDHRGKNPVKEINSPATFKNSFRTTTIHSVKGETLDAVLLLSHHNKQSKGGHFSNWIKDGNHDEEHIRFAYVACSRPSQLLVMATPELSVQERQRLLDLGFHHDI